MHDPRRRREKTLTTLATLATWEEDHHRSTQIMLGFILLMILAVSPWAISSVLYNFVKIASLLSIFWFFCSTLGEAYSSGGGRPRSRGR